jgi:RNA polymerase sigma-70 factor (ECF subfamily)
MQGYPVDEAAQILECPAGTVKSRCSRGRARLAALLPQLAPAASDSRASGAGGTDPPAGPSHDQRRERAHPTRPTTEEVTDP